MKLLFKSISLLKIMLFKVLSNKIYERFHKIWYQIMIGRIIITFLYYKIGGRIMISPHMDVFNIHINKLFMKQLTYFLSFFAYVSIHILRMGYSSVKPYFKQSFELNSVFLGLFDGLVYIALSLGFFFRYLLQGKTSKTKIYLIYGTVTSIAYFTIPSLGMMLKNDQGTLEGQSGFIRFGIPGVALLVFGFCQFTAWPVLLYFVNKYFKKGTMLGVWSANGDVGNVCGFFLGSIILISLEMNWQWVMFIGAGIHLAMSIAVYFLLNEDKMLKNQENTLQNQEILISKKQVSRKERWFQFLRFSWQVCHSVPNVLYLITFGLMKAILYGFLLWMPTYLKHKGFARQATYAPIIFNAATIIGSTVLGYFYGEKKVLSKSQYDNLSLRRKISYKLVQNIKSYSIFYSCSVITLSIILFYTLQFSVAQTFILNGLTGFFLGGAFNMLASNQVISIAKGEPMKVQMLSTLSMVCGNLFVGIVQIVIGIALDIKTDYSKQSNLFVVLLIISALAAIVILVRSTMLYKERKGEQKILVKYDSSVLSTEESI